MAIIDLRINNHYQGIAMRRYQHLSNDERLYIQHGLRANKTQKMIADELSRNPSTISREVRRNKYAQCHLYTHYWACHAVKWRKRIQYEYISDLNTKLRGKTKELTLELLKQYLSPEQVSGYLLEHHGISLCHETIYRYIYSSKIINKELKPFLRQGKRRYRKRYGSSARSSLIPNRRSIAERPMIVDKKARIGDWECDTVIGKDRKSALVTVVERKSLFTVMATVKRKTAEQVSNTMIKLLEPYKDRVKTLTFDNGTEFMRHEKIGKVLGAKTYFANPYSSWERGINENTNGLVRQFFPKGTNFNEVNWREIKRALYLLNNRPRKTRKYQTPNQIFNQLFIPLIES